MKRSTMAAAAALLATAAPAAAMAGPPTSTAPSTTTDPYVVPAAPGVETRSLLTVGDSVGGYRMVGIPDGLGVFPARSREPGGFGLLMNHELRDTAGVPRAHGQRGAFVSKWSLAKDGTVTSGEDLIRPGVEYWDYAGERYTTSTAPLPAKPDAASPSTFHTFAAAFSRFCSSTLSQPGDFLARGRGTREQILFAGEENGTNGRVFGALLDGRAKQLPRLGLASWENAVPADTRSATSLVVGLEDSGDGQVWAYAGEKQAEGDEFDRAGLTNGANHVVRVPGAATDAQFRAAYGKGTPAPFSLSEVGWNQSGTDQNAEAEAEGITLNRVEDGHWDPRWSHRNDFYFLTTEGSPYAGGDGGGLWRLRFADAGRPELGGTLTLLLDGTESWGAGEPRANKPDNMGMDGHGNLLIQEDPGNNDSIARILAFEVDSGRRGTVARFDPAQFGAGAPGLITRDEESSGIVNLRGYKDGRSWIFDAQVHRGVADPELVEMGQLLLLRLPANLAGVYTEGGAS